MSKAMAKKQTKEPPKCKHCFGRGIWPDTLADFGIRIPIATGQVRNPAPCDVCGWPVPEQNERKGK